MEKIPVVVEGITGSAPYQGYMVLLKEKFGQSFLPIFVGVAEAHSINILNQGQKFLRPLTYDLIGKILTACNSQVEEVVITHLKDHTFYAEISLSIEGVLQDPIDARPSDSIAIALKTKAPIYVYEDVMKEAGLKGYKATDSEQSLDEKIIQIDDLNRKLSRAVESERFEDAAILRDKIRNLEKDTDN